VTTAELTVIREGGAAPRAARGPTPWRQILSRMWLVTLVDFCYGWSLWVFLTWLPSYLSEARGFELDRIALMTTLPLLGGVVGDTLGGIISDTIFRRTGNLRLARRALLVAGLGGAFAFIVPAVVTGSAMSAVFLLAAAFFFLELTNAVLWTLPLDIAGQYAGTAGGMMNTGFGVAGMISPLVFGVLIQRTGRYELPFFISAGLLLVGALCSLAIDPTSRVETVVQPVDSGIRL
jgi:ACS family D-galactonate transporter-like MFS transporter